MKTEILNVRFDNVTRTEAKNKLFDFLKTEKNNLVFTPNPEMVMIAKRDKYFLHILNSGSLVIPDGIGIVFASKLNKVMLSQRVTGCDLIYDLFNEIKKTDYTVYLLGGKPGVGELAKQSIESDFGIKVVGIHNGYFNETEEKQVIEDICNLKPNILLVGLGTPKQEKWIYKYKDKLPVKISMGVGGTIDVMAKTVMRAPETFQKIGMEWLYRLLKQPKRFIRILQIPIFVFNVIISKFIRNR